MTATTYPHTIQDWAVLPETHQDWLWLLRRAVDSPQPIADEDLLVIRDHQGRPLRQRQPERGVKPREGAVLLLCYPEHGGLNLLLTRRSESLPQHPGQVSLPGGKIDPEDAGAEDAALREAEEEVGLDRRDVDVWGRLDQVYIPPSNFRITPIVAVMDRVPRVQPNPGEVAEVFAVDLRRLLDPATVVVEEWSRLGIPALVPFYYVGGHKVWGATALVLSELVARLRRAAQASGAEGELV
jgi:8-oxo-dGTP pyrophosphatase MutT (NUDIX family)